MTITVVWTIFCSCVMLLLWTILYNLFFSPLSRIPGPILAKLTSKWLTIHEVLGNRSSIVEKAHERYGPVVRLAPKELSFSNHSCIKELYWDVNRFPKSGRYLGFAGSTPSSFDMIDTAQNRERKHLVRHVLAISQIDDSEPLIANHVRKSLAWVQRSQGEPLEIMLWLRRLLLDIAGALFLGQQFEALDHNTPPAFLDDLDNFFLISALRWNAPWTLKVMSWLPIQSLEHFLKAQQRIYSQGQKAFDAYIEEYGRYSDRRDTLTKMIGAKNEKAPTTDEEISNEVVNLLIGATDPNVIILTWLLWQMAQRPEWQTAIRQELIANQVEFVDGVPTMKQISSLSILDSVILESMRLHPVHAVGLPRIANSDESTIGGVRIPKGTIVSMQSRNVHRDPAVFPSPAEFLPSRWIDTQGGTKEMKDSFLTFSKGPRSCPGQYLATMEIKLLIASVVAGWNIRVGEETTAETMAQEDQFVAVPKARACHLVFDPVV